MTDKIIIVEDDAALAAGLGRALASEQRDIRICGRLADAEKLMTGSVPVLVILDVNLPDGSGYDFLERLRQHSDVPVILLTANDMEADIVSGLEMGADDYITKPFSLGGAPGEGEHAASQESDQADRRMHRQISF